MTDSKVFYGNDYLAQLREHYPEHVKGEALMTVDDRLHIGFVKMWSVFQHIVGVDAPNRFQPFSQRQFGMSRDAWSAAAETGPESMRRIPASSTYKGLIHLKPPFDIVLYSTLIWELRPATIIEFGALQGGSALWFADQMEACGGAGEVHSFELLDKCIHATARHHRLHFHRADLRNLQTLDRSLFARLPHPWLVVDDAHENVQDLMRFLGEFLVSGDYCVIEDILLRPTAELISQWVLLCEELGLVVDTKYTDAFGYNVTCSPNSWFRKM